LRTQIDEQRRDVSRDLEAIGDRVSPSRMVARRRARMRVAWHDTRDRLVGSADDIGDSAAQAASGIRHGVQSAAAGAKDGVMELPDAARRQARGAPLVATGVAFGAGFLLAIVLPTTDKETELAERFEGELSSGAREVKAGVTEMVRDVADNLSPDVQGAGQAVTEHAKDAAEQIKTNATNR
jgi:hypothetical protein